LAFGSTPTDSSGIPIGCVYVPGVGFKALQGGTLFTDASSNDSAPAAFTNVGGFKATYAASMQALVPVTGCTDLFTITGSATKLIKVLRIGMVGTTVTTPITVEVQLIKRSTANTAGTSSAPTNLVTYDSTNAAATATVLGYTANPTLGTVAGILSAEKTIFTIPSTATMLQTPNLWFKEFGLNPGQLPTLRGVAQVLAINLVATTLGTACSTDCYVIWSEE
jgi:hypothetical protein